MLRSCRWRCCWCWCCCSLLHGSHLRNDLAARQPKRAPCVPSSLKPKSQSRGDDGIVALGLHGSFLLAHSHTDPISFMKRHCVTLTPATTATAATRETTTVRRAPPRQCIVRKFTRGIPTSIGIVPNSCSRFPCFCFPTSVSCDTCLAHFARFVFWIGIAIGIGTGPLPLPLMKSTCPRKCKPP
ncbi:LOW QUALITY PROTEIN: uncharacterized protein Dana_GF27198, partial [Drosophila ananassae]